MSVYDRDFNPIGRNPSHPRAGSAADFDDAPVGMETHSSVLPPIAFQDDEEAFSCRNLSTDQMLTIGILGTTWLSVIIHAFEYRFVIMPFHGKYLDGDACCGFASKTLETAFLSFVVIGAMSFIFVASPFLLWAFNYPEPESLASRRRNVGLLVILLLHDIPFFTLELLVFRRYNDRFLNPLHTASFVISVATTAYSALTVWLWIIANSQFCKGMQDAPYSAGAAPPTWNASGYTDPRGRVGGTDYAPGDSYGGHWGSGKSPAGDASVWENGGPRPHPQPPYLWSSESAAQPVAAPPRPQASHFPSWDDGGQDRSNYHYNRGYADTRSVRSVERDRREERRERRDRERESRRRDETPSAPAGWGAASGGWGGGGGGGGGRPDW